MARSERLIKTTPEEAFTYLSDPLRHGEWAGRSHLAVEQTTPGAVSPGATFRIVARQFGRKVEDEVEVTDFRPPERIAFQSRGPGGVFDHAFEFHRTDEGTLVAKEMRPVQQPLLLSVFRPVGELVLTRRMAGDLKRIARRLENGA
jgi:uncharacterized protein YndB with AHSA1/START domain